MRYVVDASVALSFVLRDEHDDRARGLLAALKHHSLCVPPIWRAEIVSGLMQAERRRRIDAAGVDGAIAFIEALGAEVDAEGPDMPTLRTLAVAHRLTAYDALYFELAARNGMPLATNDEQLAAAAKRSGLALV